VPEPLTEPIVIPVEIANKWQNDMGTIPKDNQAWVEFLDKMFEDVGTFGLDIKWRK